MNQQLKVLVAVDGGISRDAIEFALPEGGGMDVVGVVDGIEDAWKTLQATSTDMLIIACSGYSDRVLYLIDSATKQQPDRPVIVMCEGSSNGFVQRVFDAGADDFIALPETAEHLRFALQKAMARKRGAALASGAALGPFICVLGPKGGTGKTLTAVNLAVALAGAGRRVAVVDLDLQFGDLGLALGLPPERTIHDLARSAGTLDSDKLDGYLMHHSSGVKALLAPTRPDHASGVTVEFLRDVYATMRGAYDVVVVDTPPGFNPEVIASIDSSSHVCMVGMLDALSLKNTKLGLETLDLMGYEQDRVRLVLNRADTKVGITRDDVAAIIGRRPDVFIPSNRDIPRAINEGLAIVQADPKSEAARGFSALAQMYMENGQEPQRPAKSGRRSLFRRKA